MSEPIDTYIMARDGKYQIVNVNKGADPTTRGASLGIFRWTIWGGPYENGYDEAKEVLDKHLNE